MGFSFCWFSCNWSLSNSLWTSFVPNVIQIEQKFCKIWIKFNSCPPVNYSLHCTNYSLHCTNYSLHCTNYSLHCTNYRLHCTNYRLHCTNYRLHCTNYSLHCTNFHETHCSTWPGPTISNFTKNWSRNLGSMDRYSCHWTNFHETNTCQTIFLNELLYKISWKSNKQFCCWY